MDRGKILIVEDEFLVAANLQADLEAMGYRVIGLASSGDQALGISRRETPDLVLMDIKIRGAMDGIETAKRLRQESDIPAIFITAFADDAFIESAKSSEPLGYLVKPFDKKELHATIEMARYKAKMERQLKESETRFRTLFEYAPVAYQSLDESGCYIDVNTRMYDLVGYTPEELLGRRFAELWSTASRHTFVERFARFKKEGNIRVELQLVHKDGSPLTVLIEGRIQNDIDGRFIQAHCVLYNITERKREEEERMRIEQRLQQAQKAESLRRMAGAIAHHFNNILEVVMGSLELTLLEVKPGGDIETWIRHAVEAACRAAEISRLMLVYLGQTPVKRESVDLARSMEEAVSRLRASIPENVHLKVQVPHTKPIVLADRGHIEQILNNLVANAAESIGEAEGHVTLSVNVMDADEIRKSRCFPLDWAPKENTYAGLSVSDTGCGLDRETQEMIFDPFFSTKFTGRGLGLPVVLGLVSVYEGAITIESRPDQSTTFTVHLPLPKP